MRTSSYVQPGRPGKPSQDRLAVQPLENEGLLCVLSDGVGMARDPERCAERVVRWWPIISPRGPPVVDAEIVRAPRPAGQ